MGSIADRLRLLTGVYRDDLVAQCLDRAWILRELEHGAERIAVDDPMLASASDTVQLGSSSCGEDVCQSAQSLEVNLYGCGGFSHNPHKSGSAGKKGKSEITGKSWTRCSIIVPFITVSNQLYRDHTAWWGIEGRPGSSSKANRIFVEAVAVTACNNDQYLNQSFHRITGINGKLYQGWTGAIAWVNC